MLGTKTQRKQRLKFLHKTLTSNEPWRWYGSLLKQVAAFESMLAVASDFLALRDGLLPAPTSVNFTTCSPKS